MCRWYLSAVLGLLAAVAPAAAAELTGLYVEARTCDIWTGSCFGNAEMNLSGKNAVMGWKVEKGTMDNVRLDGLGVVAVISASNTLGLEQTGPARAMLFVDVRADESQRKALIKLARQQGREFTRNIVGVKSAPVTLFQKGQGNDAFNLTAGAACLQTRRLDPVKDRACGGEHEFYPPLAGNVKVRAAVAVEHSFNGQGFRETWRDNDRRSAYVGRFEVR